MAIFVMTCYNRPTDGANSGSVGARELDAAAIAYLKAEWRLKPGDPLLEFLETAIVGQYIEAQGTVIFRSK